MSSISMPGLPDVLTSNDLIPSLVDMNTSEGFDGLEEEKVLIPFE